jgi:hypothetical protein
MERKIVRPDGSQYMTAVHTGEFIEFRNFAANNYTVRFDVKVLDQLVPFLNEVQFWRKAHEKSD